MKVRLEVGESEGKLSLLLPEDIAAAMDLKHGDRVDVDLHGKPIELSPSLRREHLASLRKFRGWLPAGFKFDRTTRTVVSRFYDQSHDVRNPTSTH